MNKKIAIIGGGNLGCSIAEGLLLADFARPEDLMVTRRNTGALQNLAGKGVLVSNNNTEAVRFADLVIIAVKPFQTEELLATLQPELNESRHVLVSVVTGISSRQMQQALKKPMPIVRAMPNTAIAIQQSMTCLSAFNINAEQMSYVESIFAQLGLVTWIDEKLMEAATVLGACGTAYAMRYIRANIQGGIEIGFNAATASLIAAQTVKGAAELLLKRGLHPEQEIDKVTTPKGCTIAGLNEMEHQGFSSSLIKGLITSYEKIAKE
jgi:pyrroline-5-carboxylate reductase